MVEITDAHGKNLNVDAADEGIWRGFHITLNKTVNLIKVTKTATNATADTAFLYPDGGGTGNVIATASFSGTVATFPANTQMDQGTTYLIITGMADKSVYQYRHNNTGGYPINKININYLSSVGLNSSENEVGAGANNFFTLDSITTEEVVAGTNMQINITDSWKTVDAMQINIGDVWKPVAGAQINIGDAWKTIY